MKELPCPITDEPHSQDTKHTDGADMKIAWRYKDLPQQQVPF